MNIIRRIQRMAQIKSMGFLEFFRPSLLQNIVFFTKKAELYADYCRTKGFVIGDDERLLISPNIKMWLDSNAKIVIKKAEIEPYPRPPNPLIPNVIGLGVEYDSRFIPFPQTGISTIDLKKGARLEIESGVYLCPGMMIRAREGAHISIRAGTCFGHNVIINTQFGLSIGKQVRIAQGAILMDYDGHPIWNADNKKPDILKGKPIIIEDNVWIGMRAIILKGVKISCGSIVGAGAVVTKNVPPYSMVVGNPAKLVKENVKWSSF